MIGKTLLCYLVLILKVMKSQENCGVLNSSKKATKLFPDFCPRGIKWVKSIDT